MDSSTFENGGTGDAKSSKGIKSNKDSHRISKSLKDKSST